MPELPEVETVRRSLARRIVGRAVTGCIVRETRFRTPIDRAALQVALRDRRVVGVERRSKYLLIALAGEDVLVLHLGMSGRLDLVRRGTSLLPHTHVQLELDGGDELRFSDPRRFGMLFVTSRASLPAHPRFADLGIEPFDRGFTADYLLGCARTSRRPVKNFLMDARVVVGVGNIYASEALHRARVRPSTSVRRLSPQRMRSVHAAVRAVLAAAVRAGGTTLQDFRDTDGHAGRFRVRLRVYDRDGEACRRCGRTIRRIVQAGRSTFYCPGCQH